MTTGWHAGRPHEAFEAWRHTQEEAMALPKFEKQPVSQAAVKITNAGDGLSEAMRLAPDALELGEEVWVVLKGEVTRVAHQRGTKDDGLTLVRVHTVKASDVALVAKDAVQELLHAEQDRIAKLREEEEGVQRLIDDGGE
jgi:hypothetical protein